jgi:hypothetical protein
MKNLMRMIILNFGRVTIKFEPYTLELEMQTFSQCYACFKIIFILINVTNIIIWIDYI